MSAVKLFLFLITTVTVSCKPIDVLSGITVVDPLTIHNDDSVITTEENVKVNLTKEVTNAVAEIMVRNQIRPGMLVETYAVELTADVNADTFSGKAILRVTIMDGSTTEDSIILYAENLNINAVKYSLFGGATLSDANFNINDDGHLEINVQDGHHSTVYTFHIEYTGSMEVAGRGFYAGHTGDDTYVAMNLNPTYARHVFPCMDEPTEVTRISFTFKNLPYTNMVSNSLLEENSANQFRAIQGPPHVWGMLAHNFVNINIPVANTVFLYGQAGLNNQDAQASAAINFYYNALNEWTQRKHSEIILNQDGRLTIVALPDVDREWNALSTVGIWEPYVFMELTHSVKQRKTALVKIAEAMARQWFGYVIFPQNWRYQWVVSGLATYSAYEIVKSFQTGTTEDVSLLDFKTIFVTDVIQESLLRDAYINSQPIEPSADLFAEDEIRAHLHGLLKYKAPALMRMMRLVLGDANKDFIHSAAKTLTSESALQPVNRLSFTDAINSDWLFTGNGAVPNIPDYVQPWLVNTGYPLVTVNKRQGGVIISQERFGFTRRTPLAFLIPVTYTTSTNPNFDNVYPVQVTDLTLSMDMALGEDDWVVFNIQGQGYYRVNYDNDLWGALTDALGDPDRRNKIHPLNRATLIDDALNIARAGRIDYGIALSVVLTMEHETEYAVWKAFVRNMDFLRKRLIALVSADEDLDPDIYVRMIRRTVGAVESELGFHPNGSQAESAMQTLTRGLVMEHACKANYQPCVAAAVDWFYDPNSDEPQVNPNIPREIRPAVYCTMMREGDDKVVTALRARFDAERNHYERIVILESFGCSHNDNFINTLLVETIAANSPYLVEERVKIFTSVVESSPHNAGLAFAFMRNNIAQVRTKYGGDETFEQLIALVGENMADHDMSDLFKRWVQSNVSNLDSNQLVADRVLEHVNENELWVTNHLEAVYEWIDENDAPTLTLSIMAIAVSIAVALLIQ